MTTLHDDLPHPVPGYAHLRYKENYFFILMAPRSDAFGVFHLNHEPGHDRARYTGNFRIGGRSIDYGNRTGFPADFVHARRIGDGRLSLAFVRPHQSFDLTLETGDISLDLRFEARFATFDYAACQTAGNPAPSFQETMTLGLNLPYNHQQQALTAKGSARFADGTTILIDGMGYRDHSWVMRADVATREHDWCGFNFPSRAFGIKTLETMMRSGIRAKEGYVADAEGLRALRRIETTRTGRQSDGLCETLIHEVEDVFGQRYRIESDVAGRFAHVPLASEEPSGASGYHIVENFCPATCAGETGVGLVEIGRNSAIAEPFT
ncbi:hypothetical protein [Croceicoccus sp. YJ47]|uniref:DUF7064 domain-containing protein n=1 Tax=Croceicoccus sp. YJ47 TaxID=2798724 RepID=UPI001922BC09|nr:hypothetical protein [Croceicoccus sp. YJ47]QQN75272.1 hypothetical protein JD971_06345 [Croceicoccus sp. YJ47]